MAINVNAIKPAQKKPFYKDLIFQVLVAIVVGALIGVFYPTSVTSPEGVTSCVIGADEAGKCLPGLGERMKPFGDAFINLIKMMIAPIIFCTIVTGIAGMGNLKSAGRVGLKALIYFEVVTTFALVIGLVMVNVLQPGAGMNIDPATLDAGAVAAKTKGAQLESTSEFLMNIIPHSLVGAFADNNILQVLLVSILFAAGLAAYGKKGKPVFEMIDRVSHILFAMIGFIMKVAPLGAFGAIAFTIGAYGLESLASLGRLVAQFYMVCLIFIFVVLGAILSVCKLSILRFLKYIKEELVIVLGTSSSETVLPRMIDKLTQLGCSKPVVGMVIPTGYSFNLDGTSIYLTMAAVFIAQATGTPMTLTEELTLLGVLLLTSKGAAGVAGSGFVVLAATLATVGHVPVAGIALILGVDAFMSRGRALTNLIGNGIATVVVAKWEGAFDEKRARDVLAGRVDPDIQTDPDDYKVG